MSEKRFTIKPQDDYWAVVDNYNEDKVCIINGIHTKIEAIWLCDFMNEQQDTICKLQDLCGKSDYENAKLLLKNKEQAEEIKLLKPTNVEQYEQIVQLQEENEQLRENLHNCRINKNIIREKLKIWQDVHKKYNIYSIKDFEKLMKKVK